MKNIYERLLLYLVYSDFLCSLVSSDRRRSLGIQNVRNGTKLTRKFKIIAMENFEWKTNKKRFKNPTETQNYTANKEKKKSGFVKATYFQSNGKISKSLKELKYVLFRSSVRNVARKFKFKPFIALLKLQVINDSNSIAYL